MGGSSGAGNGGRGRYGSSYDPNHDPTRFQQQYVRPTPPGPTQHSNPLFRPFVPPDSSATTFNAAPPAEEAETAEEQISTLRKQNEEMRLSMAEFEKEVRRIRDQFAQAIGASPSRNPVPPDQSSAQQQPSAQQQQAAPQQNQPPAQPPSQHQQPAPQQNPVPPRTGPPGTAPRPGAAAAATAAAAAAAAAVAAAAARTAVNSGAGGGSKGDPPPKDDANGKEDKKGRKPPPDPGDSSSDDEGKGKRRSGPRRSSLFITPETYQEPENARQITPKCEVALFKRGTDMTIENWVMQMEAYFTLAKIPMDSFAGFMLTKIDSLHFTEVLPLMEKKLSYYRFRDQLFRIFGAPDAIHAYIQELNRIRQERDERISDFMNRVRTLALKAHPYVSHSVRERILITHFVSGLYDGSISTHLAVRDPHTSAEAERIALSAESMRKELKARKSTGAYVAPEVELQYSGDEEEEDPEYAAELDEEEEFETALAAADSGPRRGIGRRGPTRVGPGPRGKTRSFKPSVCYRCGQPGHFRSECKADLRGGPSRASTGTDVWSVWRKSQHESVPPTRNSLTICSTVSCRTQCIKRRESGFKSGFVASTFCE